MAGRVFPALKHCSIKFPHHVNTIVLQPVSMPCCTWFKYDSNDLGPSRYFSHAPLHRLDVKSGQWSVWRGNYQFISFLKPIVMANAQSLTTLKMHGQCSESLLNGMLKLVPALECLGLGPISPHALSEKFYQQFVATGSSASSSCEMIWLPRLNSLYLSYKRWLRDSERQTLIPVLADIVESDQELSVFLYFPNNEDWNVGGQVESFGEMQSDENVVMGISSPHGIVLVSLLSPAVDSDCWPFKEAEYLHIGNANVSIDVLSDFHHLVELRTREPCYFIEPTALPVNLPFYHVIRVLKAEGIHPSYFAGQTLHKLERCRVHLDWRSCDLSEGLFTEMPVCTRLDVRDLSLLATFKLPLVCELGVAFDHPESNLIWEEDIAVNANLSGLSLLHVHDWHDEVDLIQILASVPVLESLIVGNGAKLNVHFFRALVPNRTSGPNGLTQIPTVLCPMLKSLQVEGVDPTEQSEMMHVLRVVVMLRAVEGSPLKWFTFVVFQPGPGSVFEMIGEDGSLTMEKTLLDEGVEPFELAI
jgi:hypothetical protein